MVETAVSTPDPDEPEWLADAEAFQADLDRCLPGAKLVMPNWQGRPSGQIDVTDCVSLGQHWNGRLDGDQWGYDVRNVIPPKPPGYDSWREQVKRSVRKERDRIVGIPNRLKAIPDQVREYARYRIHDYLIGWVLDVNTDPWTWSDSRSKVEREKDAFLSFD